MSLLLHIAARRSEIKAQLQALRAEMRELDIAEAAIASRSQEGKSEAELSRQGKFTIKQMVLDVLEHEAGGSDANGIINLIHAKHGVSIERSSLSPQLSRLKAEGKIHLEGSIWKLVSGGVFE